MATIKFSHAYTKLKYDDGSVARTATLLQVISITLDQLSKEFIDYDTDKGIYKLTYSTLYMMLIFQKPDGNIFTTLRPQFNQMGNKMPYYLGLVGKEFDLVITEGKEAAHA